jgi:hypothetical protein
MTIVTSMGVVAILFIVFGLFVSRRECRHDGGCAGCGAACHRPPSERKEII